MANDMFNSFMNVPDEKVGLVNLVGDLFQRHLCPLF